LTIQASKEHTITITHTKLIMISLSLLQILLLSVTIITIVTNGSTRRPTSSFVECLSIHPHKLISSKPSLITTITTKVLARSRRSSIRNNSSYSISSRISSSRRVRPLFHSNRRGNNEEDATIDNLSTNQQQQFIYDESQSETNSDTTNKSDDDDDDDDVEQKESISTSTTSEDDDVIYRIAASSDGKLERAFCQSPLLPKLHAIYHASTHFDKNNRQSSRQPFVTATLPSSTSSTTPTLDTTNELEGYTTQSNNGINNSKTNNDNDDGDEQQDDSTQEFASLRKALQDAGFCRLDKRDLELCEALNEGYLLRLAIAPDVKGLDDEIARDFYPELVPSVSSSSLLSSSLSSLLLKEEYTPTKEKGIEYASKLKKSLTAYIKDKTNDSQLMKEDDDTENNSNVNKNNTTNNNTNTNTNNNNNNKDDTNTTSTTIQSSTSPTISNPSSLQHQLLFNGKILVFRRGYTSEQTQGLFLGQKIDYLQSSLVQRSFSKLAIQVGTIERQIVDLMSDAMVTVRLLIQNVTVDIVRELPGEVGLAVEELVQSVVGGGGGGKGGGMTNTQYENEDEDEDDNNDYGDVLEGKTTTRLTSNQKRSNSNAKSKISFRRYGGRYKRFTGSDDAVDSALSPFLVCEVSSQGTTSTTRIGSNSSSTNPNILPDVNPMDESMFYNGIANDDTTGIDSMSMAAASGSNARLDDNDTKEYMDEDDMVATANTPPPPLPSIRLLKRVSISDLVDFFSKEGRQKLIKSFTSTSNLVEPAFEEVVVIWRPLPPKTPQKLQLPDSVYKLAKTLTLESRLPPKQPPSPKPKKTPLQIRAFSQVPMANLLAILPKTKLLFRPADAILFDLVNVVSLSVILASQKTDSAYLDILAVGSVSLWIVRTFVKYSNKQARYDLLVNKFLTSRMEHRNQNALEYVSNEAAEQRAMRASLLHEWLICQQEQQTHSAYDLHLTKYQILRHGSTGMNQVLQRAMSATETHAQQYEPVYADVDICAALNDLVDLHLIRFDEEESLVEVKDYIMAKVALQSTWVNLFQKET